MRSPRTCSPRHLCARFAGDRSDESCGLRRGSPYQVKDGSRCWKPPRDSRSSRHQYANLGREARSRQKLVYWLGRKIGRILLYTRGWLQRAVEKPLAFHTGKARALTWSLYLVKVDGSFMSSRSR